MNEIKISVIVPIYNTDKYLNHCIESILSQTYKNIEIILVDDGSTDSSGEICDVLKAKEDKVVIIHQENKGQLAAKKTGVRHATGEYIGFVDSDDWIEGKFYERLVSVIEKTGVDMVSSGIIFDWPDGKCEYKYDLGKEHVYKDYKEISDFFNGMLIPDKDNFKIRPNHCTKLFKASLLQKVIEDIDDRIRWHEDDCLVYSYISLCKSFTFLHEAFYHYVQNMDSCHNQTDPLFFARANYLRNSMLNSFSKSEYGETLNKQLDVYFVKMLEEGIAFFGNLNDSAKGYRVILSEYVKECATVAVYGVGRCGKRIIDYLLDNTDVQIVALFDEKLAGSEYRGITIYAPEAVCDFGYERVLVSIKDRKLYKDVQKRLCEIGVPGYKIDHLFI